MSSCGGGGNGKLGTSAQKRWRLLARALTSSSEEARDAEDEVSVRRFTSFGLLRPMYLEHEPGCSWLLYTTLVDAEVREVLVSWITRCFTPNDLIGFNNTGNVCVWPSEECLAYYLLKNPGICHRRRVLELGGGMSCLAGVLVAKYCGPAQVTLTDGNSTSVANVQRIVARNGMSDDLVETSVVQWAEAAKALRQSANSSLLQEFNGRNSYDVILCADCLFFDEARQDLVDTIHGSLAEDGLALVVAPRRGSTFRKFTEAAVQRGFQARESERYDDAVWSLHEDLLETNLDYCPDLHFPVLLELTKKKKLPSGC